MLPSPEVSAVIPRRLWGRHIIIWPSPSLLGEQVISTREKFRLRLLFSGLFFVAHDFQDRFVCLDHTVVAQPAEVLNCLLR